MGTNPTKALDNIYCQCRKEAAKFNNNLFSREGASELLGISVSSLADYELGNTTPPADKVNLMAEIYNSPELRNYNCANECPIGKMNVPQLDIKDLSSSALTLLSTLRKVSKISETILDVTEDNVIDENEKPMLNEIIETLNLIAKQSDEFKISIEKMLKNN